MFALWDKVIVGMLLKWMLQARKKDFLQRKVTFFLTKR